MKRINILLSFIVAALFVACSKPSLEEIAIERSKKYISPYDNYVKMRFSSDSICIIERYAMQEDPSNSEIIDEEENVKPSEYYLMWTTDEEPILVEFYNNRDDGSESIYLEVFEFCERNEIDFFDNTQHSLRIGAKFRDEDKWIKVEE